MRKSQTSLNNKAPSSSYRTHKKFPYVGLVYSVYMYLLLGPEMERGLALWQDTNRGGGLGQEDMELTECWTMVVVLLLLFHVFYLRKAFVRLHIRRLFVIGDNGKTKILLFLPLSESQVRSRVRMISKKTI
jgi:hypothetical protein